MAFSTASGRCTSWRVWRGAMWAPGGFAAVINRTTAPSVKFIQLHAQLLSEEFSVALVKMLVGKLRLASGTVAGDGTVIELGRPLNSNSVYRNIVQK